MLLRFFRLRHQPRLLPRFLLLALVLGSGFAHAQPQPDGGEMTAPPVVDPKRVITEPVAPDGSQPAPGERQDGFGEQGDMKPVAVLQKHGEAGWEDGFEAIVQALKDVDAELKRLGLTPTALPLIIYTKTDDAGFDFEAAVPFTGATTSKPQEGFELAASPAGKAMRFTHRGAYDAMDPTYEQIANLLDAKDLEAQDYYVEEYRTDPRTSSADDLVIDIWVPLK
ncbi:MAG TPA: GyrI-like domain-containing protein [Xanthobacteraceae bacterium]|nr:GyrI-like domain-containing protein [Xanthobacteraceae bacterium]